MWKKSLPAKRDGARLREPTVARGRLFGSLLLAIGALGVAFAGAYNVLQRVTVLSRDELRSQAMLSEVLSARADISDVQSAQRAYMLTGDSGQFAAYRMARARLDNRLTRAAQLAGPHPEDRRALDSIARLTRERLDTVQALVEARTATDPESLRRAVQQGNDELLTARLRIELKDFQDTQDRRVGEADRALTELTGTARLAWAAIAVLVMLGSLLAFAYLYRQANSRRRAEVELRRTIRKQERVLFEVSAMSTMMELVHICRSQSEANHVISEVLPQLLPTVSGALYVMRPPQGALELQFGWGDSTMTKVFAPDECWALRRSRTHLVERTRSAIMCRHIEPSQEGCLCAPLVGHGEVLGVLHLACTYKEGLSADVQRLAGVLAEQLSLALGNLRLQETLRSKSERDPLTDLYNRRHLELSAERELARAGRHAHALTFIMLDVDHFKVFNDTHGHDAGDAVLREVAHVLKRHTRTEDIACRYGGEEFLLVLPGCPLEDAYLKAEAIREAIAQLRVSAGSAALSRVTASLGIACYPHNGDRVDELIRAADAALYKAKAAGRNQIVATSAPGDVMLFEADSADSASAA
jgi:diguanylate cyclase (GGDEF)-like protein